jgi:hypothetical protein
MRGYQRAEYIQIASEHLHMLQTAVWILLELPHHIYDLYRGNQT